MLLPPVSGPRDRLLSQILLILALLGQDQMGQLVVLDLRLSVHEELSVYVRVCCEVSLLKSARSQLRESGGGVSPCDNLTL